jgi:hypothetical protein
MQKHESKKSLWQDADGWHCAHVVGHAVTIRQLDARTLDVSIDGHSRRWRATGKNPLKDAEKAILAMLTPPRGNDRG